jgi:CRP/FNR family transcriptional regulator, nitrogen fixation regulation protein
MHIQPNFRTNTHEGLDDLLTGTRPAAVTFFQTDATVYAQGDVAGPPYLVEFGWFVFAG